MKNYTSEFGKHDCALPHDSLGAFCRDNHIVAAGAGSGPLEGLTFAVKDVFHVRGGVTGFGHPDWLHTHGVATDTAAAVQQLLDAGATMVGKTVTDELAYSLSGQNYHYGTPINPRDPTRVPGGSSSGSASAVAGGIVDFSLGTDCGGSVRIPASYCGLFGMRPTHGRVSLKGAIPFAPSFDCAGWFARDADLLEKVGRALLGNEAPRQTITRVLLAEDGLAELAMEAQRALLPAIRCVEERIGRAQPVTLSDDGLDRWSETFRILQAAEIWDSLGPWIEEVRPAFGPGIRERFAAAARLDPSLIGEAKKRRLSIRQRLAQILPAGTALLVPTAPHVAPALSSDNDGLETSYRHQAMNLLCVAGLGGLPQISLPMAELHGLPIGLSLIGDQGTDLPLLEFAKKLCGRVA
jgi:amidase